MSETVLIALISTGGGIVISYITYVLSQKYQTKKSTEQPKDRMEQLMDGYERFIRQKDKEFDRKLDYIKVIEEELAATKKHVGKLEDALEITTKELEDSREENAGLKRLLDQMRKEYKHQQKHGTIKP